MFLLLATTALWQEILKCYHWEPQGSFMHRLWTHGQVQLGAQRHLSLRRRGWWRAREKTKARWHRYFHIHYHNYMGGVKDVVNFFLKTAPNYRPNSRFSKNGYSLYFLSCQPISQPQKLPDPQQIGVCACSVHFILVPWDHCNGRLNSFLLHTIPWMH